VPALEPHGDFVAAMNENSSNKSKYFKLIWRRGRNPAPTFSRRISIRYALIRNSFANFSGVNAPFAPRKAIDAMDLGGANYP
jgi:hypothetical protein